MRQRELGREQKQSFGGDFKSADLTAPDISEIIAETEIDKVEEAVQYGCSCCALDCVDDPHKNCSNTLERNCNCLYWETVKRDKAAS